MNWYLQCLKRYAQFSGRAQRKEFWFFSLFNALAVLVLSLADYALGLSLYPGAVGTLAGVYSLATLVPGLAVGVRRLHDTDHSGWWMLLSLIPVLGELVLLVFFASRGTAGNNRYGEEPTAPST